jgi:hypothetical protein
MASTRQQIENQVASATDRAQELAAKAVAGTTAAVDSQRRETADALGGAAKLIDRQADRLPKPLDEYADSVKDGLGSAARYVRRHDVREMAEDAADRVSQSALAKGLLIGAVVVGGGLLLSSFLREHAGEPGQRGSAFADALGPKVNESFNLFRDALIGLAVAKAVEALDGALPGFKGHFERVAQ